MAPRKAIWCLTLTKSPLRLWINEAKGLAKSLKMESSKTINKVVTSLTQEGKTEEVAFPETYDIIAPAKLGLMFREMEVPDLAVTEKS